MQPLTTTSIQTNGHILELGYGKGAEGGDVNAFDVSYRIYISGDTLMGKPGPKAVRPN